MSNEDYVIYQKWCQENLVMAIEAHKITAQSVSGFKQSIILGHIKPFLTYGAKRKTNLYLRTDLEEYAKNKQIR
ncbi:hypothetical protein AWH48_11645 [Domibacillus aminovorans]|uniref:DNA-binding protein n=2 Tax=Domibacillus aminovorans TaxID=29332 RepID=A0A177KLZ7_9BACI|nr:hypothetical protein AWH48_11645 [Domibacillus aminovorans]